jgi:serine/threonine protein kinase
VIRLLDLFMPEGTPFEVEAERLAALFTDPKGIVSEYAMTRVAKAMECVLLALQSAHRLKIRHGDLKMENLIMIPAESAPGCPNIRTDEGKKVIRLLDFGSGMLPGVHYLTSAGMEDYDARIPTSTAPPPLASVRAASVLNHASKTAAKLVDDEQAPAPGLQPYTIHSLHMKFA